MTSAFNGSCEKAEFFKWWNCGIYQVYQGGMVEFMKFKNII